jgi:uncharacterized protein (UPF0332 family)
VKPETADYLAEARYCLASARTIAAAEVLDVAAREAYFPAYHAAGAYIFERIGKAAKTHRGMKSQFNRLARHEPRIGRELLAFLGDAISSTPSPTMA